LLSGTTVFTYISGADMPTAAMPWSTYAVRATAIGFLGMALLALVGQFERLARRATEQDAALVLGWGAMLLGFFVVAGPLAIAPHFERYGICLVAPAMLLLARGLGWWLFEMSSARLARRLIIVAAWLWAASFYCNDFVFFWRTGGESHRTFRTAAIEPKQQALELVLRQRDPARPVRIVCDQWWSYWPIAYLAYGRQRVEVVSREDWTTSPRSPADRETWFVGFVDRDESDASRSTARRVDPVGPRQIVCDYGGRPLIVVIGPQEKSSQNY
jgi:hypothetical protein